MEQRRETQAMSMTVPVLQTYEDVSKWTGWCRRTILNKIKQGCFPCYRFSKTDVRFKADEILYYINGKREGSFDEKERD